MFPYTLIVRHANRQVAVQKGFKGKYQRGIIIDMVLLEMDEIIVALKIYMYILCINIYEMNVELKGCGLDIVRKFSPWTACAVFSTVTRERLLL